MITGNFHQGSGLGNQLHRYVATKVLALDKGYEHSMMYTSDGSGKPLGFKGSDFMNLDFKEVKIEDLLYYDDLTENQYPMKWKEKKIVENSIDIRGYDPEFNFINDGTIVDGEFQDERYWKHREKEVNEWLKVEPRDIPDDVCVIGFRGGEFYVFPDLGLPKSYFDDGMEYMRKINPNMKFEIHTDDPELAKVWFKSYPIIHDIGINWRSMRYAKYAIIANSSFYILPRWLRNGVTIAPRYWARRNIGVWALPQNYYSRFQYI